MELLQFQSNEPLAPRTSLSLGGSAENLVEASTLDQLTEALKWAETSFWKVNVLGAGSNVVISDDGVGGLVVVPRLRGIEVDRNGDHCVIVAAAGESWDDLVAETVAQGYLGLECLSGIPGTVGATPIQNVGAYGVEVSDVVEWVGVFDRETGATNRLNPTQCSFGYRSSRFRQFPDRWIVTQVAFRLRTAGTPVIRYPELERAVASRNTAPNAADVRNVVMDLRRSKGMVLEEGAPQSVGSFFVNPIVDPSTLLMVEVAGGIGTDVPRFEMGEGLFKIPAAWLIENAGFGRGFHQKFVGISEHHALALVHYGGGRTRDLLDLAMSIRGGVENRFGIVLRPEPVFWGFAASDPLTGGGS